MPNSERARRTVNFELKNNPNHGLGAVFIELNSISLMYLISLAFLQRKLPQSPVCVLVFCLVVTVVCVLLQGGVRAGVTQAGSFNYWDSFSQHSCKPAAAGLQPSRACPPLPPLQPNHPSGLADMRDCRPERKCRLLPALLCGMVL